MLHELGHLEHFEGAPRPSRSLITLSDECEHKTRLLFGEIDLDSTAGIEDVDKFIL